VGVREGSRAVGSRASGAVAVQWVRAVELVWDVAGSRAVVP